ncbi:HopJ type III effector protein [Flavobacterium humi]|uniref:Type III effector n=1 Tax=Flavobacterium humi TaxID=2562683 RepID=A0A4Z0LCP5_9FLAO|nr:HopJ type III effector protein [Flavobacterium humi]TGD59633.1 type III effector [Flavobacterium humi]
MTNRSIAQFLDIVRLEPQSIHFSDTIAVIEEYYDFTPTGFQNGDQYNAPGENSGSCKIFAFGLLQNLTPSEALACFGTYYFDEVLNHPNGTNHQNIRNFIKTGWNGIQFEGKALQLKKP